MAEIREGLYSLNAGEISKNALAHIDLAKLRIACEREENLLPLVLGPAMMRPGTQFLDRVWNDLPGCFLEFKKDESALALWVASSDGTLQIFDAIAESFVVRVAVGAAIDNGNFTSSIAGWTDDSEAGAAISWQAAGLLGLLGTGVNYAWASQAVATTNPGIEHALRIKIARGDIAIKIGSAAGAGDYWNVQVPEGEYSLAFVPVGGTFYVALGANRSSVCYVDLVAVEPAGRVSLAHPWTAAGDLGNLQYDRSEDVLFVACLGYQQRRLERRNTLDMRSWAIALYRTDDGPFMPANLGTTTLTPSGTSGTVTLIASRSLFHTGHLGALFRLTHASQEAFATLAGANQWTGNIRVTGVEPGRAFAISISGLVGSTVTLQRSFTDPGAWVDVQDYTSNGAFAYDDLLDNQIFWYRIGIKTGNYAGDTIQAYLSHTGSQTGIVRIVVVTNTQTASADVISHLGGTAATSDWGEGEWSDYRGWPRAVAIHDGRLFWQCALRCQGSVSDAFASYDDTVIGDSAPINRTTVASRPHWMISVLRLLVGSTLHEISVKASAFDEPLTPTAFVPRTVGNHGSAQLRAVAADGQVIYVSRDYRRVFALAFDGQKADYAPQELTRLNQEICAAGIVDVAAQQQPDTRFYLVCGDGRLVVLVHEQNEDVSALVPFTFENAAVERAACLPGGAEDRVYVLMRRGTKRCIERFAARTEAVGGAINKVMDGHIVYDGPPTTTLAGLDHLEGEVVVVWAEGEPLVGRETGMVVSGGTVTLPAASSPFVVGKPYDAFLKTSKLAYASQRGTSLAQQKRVGPVGLVMNNIGWAGVKIGRDFDHLTQLPRTYRGRPLGVQEVLAEWDQAPAALNGGWDSDPRICIQIEAPYPCTILGIAFGEQVNEGEDAPPPRQR
jgi:hypothetical protein